ncbi:MAG: hypothetical protein VXU48_02580 [Verrucomicrobiota bacterium]|nr:hypothetical protein [Verrucomicrobiota bacterium]
MNSANDDHYLNSEAYLVARKRRREQNENKIVRLELITPKKREHPVGVAILAVLGLVVGCLVGSML